MAHQIFAKNDTLRVCRDSTLCCPYGLTIAPKVSVKNYELIEHTADIGIRVKARSQKELFVNAARAMFDIIAEKKSPANPHREKIEINQQAENTDELFINWLNELLSLSSAKGVIFSDFKISKISEREIQAAVTGQDMRNYRVNTEIKAATYHQLKLEERDGAWVVEVIFDV